MRVAIVTAVLAACLVSQVRAQDNGPVQVSPEVRHDSLASLRDTIPQPDGYLRWHARVEHRIPLPYFPPGQVDGAVQSSVPRAPAAPTFQSGVDGVGQGFTGPGGTFSVNSAPPDTVGAVGATQYVQVVNTGLAVFDKSTKSVVYGPVPTNVLWTGFGGQCENDNDGDAVVVYDQIANRWVVSQFAVGTTPYLQCVAVSMTSDATGGWYRYAFSYGSVFPDYPKMGVWPDAYYETFNMFTNTFVGSQLCAYDRGSMLTGAAATQQCFQLSSTYGGVLPSDLDGSALPPANAPNYMLNFGTNSLRLWKFHVDWAAPANTTLTGPVSLAVASFTPACGGGTCVPQSGTHQQLDSLADRLMYRLAYRNFGDHESLVVNHSVTVGTSSKNPYTGVRWYEIRSPGTTPVVYQQSTFSPDSSYRWMGSIAMDQDGDIALGYSVSSGSLFPAVRYTGQLSSDPLNTMQAETSIIEGTGSQSGFNLDRWGDYSAMTIDPVDDCTFWYTNEYEKTTGAFNWSTRIGSLKFSGCGTPKQDQTISFTSIAPANATVGGSPYVVTATATSGLPVSLTIDAASSSVCSLSGGTSGSSVSFIGVGTCTIDANQAGDGSYNAAPQVQQSFAVGKGDQTITFTSTAPAGAQVGGTAYVVTATASSGLAVSLTIDASSTSVCSLSGSASGSSVSFIGVGTCTIDANQAGDSNYNAAPQAQQSFVVAKGDQAITFTSTAPSNAKYGDPAYTVTATASSALPVTLTIDAASTSVCSLSGSTSGSNVTFIGVGTCTLDANQAGNTDYNAAPQAQQSFAVGKANQTISFTSTAPASATVGGSSYTVTATASSALPVTLTIDAASSSVCSLDGSTSGSHVSFIGVGTCTIDANQAGNSNYNAAPQAQQSFAVGKGDQTITFTSTAPSNAMYGGTPYVVTATASSGLAVTLTIDAASISVCSLSGSASGSSVSFIGVGTCTIDANQGGNANYNAAPQAQQSFAVGKADQTIGFTSSAPSNAKYGDPAYTVTATASSGLAVTLTIDAASTSVCSLSGSASGSSVSFIGVGTCTIDANQSGNSNYNAAPQAQQSFGVGKASQTITFTSAAPPNATYGGVPYVVTATASSGLAVTITVDAASSSVCSLSGNTSGSSVSFIGVGTCTIDANQAGSSLYSAASQVQQSFAVGKADQAVGFTSSAPGSATYGGTPYVVTASASSGLAVTLTIDAASTSVCALSGSASGSSVSFIGVGTCTIDANQSGNANYNAAPQAQQSFGVGKASQTTTFSSTAPSNAQYGGTAYVVTATASSGLAVTLTVDAASTSVCSLSGSVSGSSVTFVGVGTCTIDANQSGNSNYDAAPQAQQSFAVGKADQTISFTSSAPGSATYGGTPYVVTASASSGLAVTLTIDAASTSVCALSGSASGSSVSFIGVGTCTIDANQGGNGLYNAAPQVQQSFAVGKAAQTINFTSSAPAGAKVGGAAYVVTATATSGLPVTLTIAGASTAVCSLSGSTSGSSVSFIGVGTCTIDANQAGNGNYNVAPQAQQSFAVGKGDQTITFTSTAPSNATYDGTPYVVTATASSGLAVMLTIDGASTAVCSLSGSTSGSSVTFIGVGTCAIDASQGGSALYNTAPQEQQSFGVGKASQTITFDSTAPSNATVGGATYQVSASATSGLAVTLAVDAGAITVCQLDGSTSGSNVSFIGAGTCTIDANQAGNGLYDAAPQTQQSFTVQPGQPTLEFTTQPATVTAGGTLATIAVTLKDPLGGVVDDNTTSVDFTVPACGGTADLGSAIMSHGVASLTSPQRFYTPTDPSTLTITAQTVDLTATSDGFFVQANSGLVFASGFEGCRL